ncbi:hypothetical protein P3T76_007608 [Phytophthora citrophthora]|uniref:PH domain-containing protein n=1 Tax=Phytophthora citrophthora TaxID=4793 RepID=A0AAD9GLZ3_9STRA|nr:hypothetical protein P3T76_007608 [Phytophthora citrophthora]
MVKVSFVLLAPYAYVDGGAEQNEAVYNFFKLFKAAARTLQDEQHLSVQLILQPNLQCLVNVDVFDLNKKVKGRWIPLAKVQQVQAASGNRHNYKILKVYPGGERERVLKQGLVVNSILGFKKKPAKNIYKLTESECFLYKKLPDGNLSEPWARCLRRSSNEWNYYWKVLKVFPSGEGHER